jgi:hypothetical protein
MTERAVKVIRQDGGAPVLRDWSSGVVAAIALPVAVFALLAWGHVGAGDVKGAVFMCGIAALLRIPLHAFARLTLIRFDRIAGSAAVTGVRLLLFRVRHCPMQGLAGATTGTHVPVPNPDDHAGERNRRRRTRKIPTWRPVLTCADGTRLPLWQACGEQIRAGRAASAVNAWLPKPRNA